jgi:hypothetical protein
MNASNFDHSFDLTVTGIDAELVERSTFFMESEVALVDDGGFDCAGTFGSAGSFGGTLGCVGTFGCCC